MSGDFRTRAGTWPAEGGRAVGPAADGGVR